MCTFPTKVGFTVICNLLFGGTEYWTCCWTHLWAWQTRVLPLNFPAPAIWFFVPPRQGFYIASAILELALPASLPPSAGLTVCTTTAQCHLIFFFTLKNIFWKVKTDKPCKPLAHFSPPTYTPLFSLQLIINKQANKPETVSTFQALWIGGQIYICFIRLAMAYAVAWTLSDRLIT